MCYIVAFILFTLMELSFQICPEEVSNNGIQVTWHETPPDNNIQSDPLCYVRDRLITRNCSDSQWIPPLNEMEPCLTIVQDFDLSSCPPGLYQVSDKNKEFCYQLNEPLAWNYPCFKSGAGSVITDLQASDITTLLQVLNTTQTSKFFWLPAQRPKLFNPLVWYIPGPNWGRLVESNTNIKIQTSILKNCLLLDVERQIIITESCSSIHPSLCFYTNEIKYPSECPDGYHATRFLSGDGACFGIEHSDTIFGSTFDNFLTSKCKKPMGDNQYRDITRFNFKRIAGLNNLSNNIWCWFETSYTFNHSNNINDGNSSIATDLLFPSMQGIINNEGTLSLMNKMSLLPCMACETEMIYGETELMFEYNDVEEIFYLTVYFPSGLWKYDNEDIGIQCFSNAKGFVKVVDINDVPLMVTKFDKLYEVADSKEVEKVIYSVNPVTDRSAQYWCEGHTKNFSLISTQKIVVNPQGNETHVFALVIKAYTSTIDEQDMRPLSNIITDITNIFDANKVLVMDILEYTTKEILILMHLHVTVSELFDDEAKNLQETNNNLKEIAVLELNLYNYTFINISSSMYCLPTTTSSDFHGNPYTLSWDLTPIGHVTAPIEFCLQPIGLPVNRYCYGSYLLGGFWGDVEGYCNRNHEPSSTTTFLYKFITKGEMSENYTSRFLTDGLSFVLDDVDIIIPADIYYISVSLQHVLSTAQKNQSSVDMGDVENIVWVMDRIMILNAQYLRLAQTLNSTNVILDSVNDIIETLAEIPEYKLNNNKKNIYQLAVEPQFMVQISYPHFNNITGIALIKKVTSENFTDMIIQPLYKNTTLDEVVQIENLEIATWLPDKTLKSLIKYNESDIELNKKEIHIVINLFQNDAVFQQLGVNKYTINSRIVGISIPGFKSNLENAVPLVFKKLINLNSSDNYCGYWNFQPIKMDSTPGYWTNDGCFSLESVGNLSVCECFHLTHFGQLLTVRNPERQESTIDESHVAVLNAITLVGCFLSLLGIGGIWITALVFHTWRQKASTKVLLQLSTAVALPLIFIIIFNLEKNMFVEENGTYKIVKNMKNMCITLGALLHYSILASFMWMLITGILQFIRYVQVLGVKRPCRFMMKFTLIGWGIPLLPVVTMLLLDSENYVPATSINEFSKPICYPQGLLLVMSVVIPICLVLITNVILFVLIIIAISKGPNGKMRATDMDLIGAQLRLSIFLFFLLGLTWIFGIFSFSNDVMWSYLFCLTSTLQGFVLFIYFVICDPSTRSLWVTLVTPQFRRQSSRQSIISISSG